MIKIDIVVPCAGRVDDVLRLLDTLHRFSGDVLRKHVASITLSDDRFAAEAGRRVQAAYPAVDYVRGPARGPAANRNRGARIGRAPWLMFLDDDCYAEADLLGAYVRRIQAAPDIDVIEGAIQPVGVRPNGNHHAPLNLAGGKLWSCNFAIRRSVFSASAGFDEQFPFACLEDCDLHQRLLRERRRMVFAPEAAVLHPWRSVSEREVSRQIVSHAIYAQKHPDFAAGWSLLHVLRALRGRWRQYTSGRFSTIPLNKYRTVGYDLVAPLLVYSVVRWPALRRSLSQRYANKPIAGGR